MISSTNALLESNQIVFFLHSRAEYPRAYDSPVAPIRRPGRRELFGRRPSRSPTDWFVPPRVRAARTFLHGTRRCFYNKLGSFIQLFFFFLFTRICSS
jgi:hypothetical protein